MNYCKNLDLEKYSAVVAVGGDGTIHEVVNGFMMRKDGKKLPIGFLPNGTGNDMCGAIELDNVEQGLQYLAKGNTIKVDVLEATLDFETANDVRKYAAEHSDFDISRSLRYCVINT
jgi:diacylglycerol kinase family enzyme